MVAKVVLNSLDANILQNLDNAKYLNEINIIIGQIILNSPSCFLKRDGGFFLSYNYLSILYSISSWQNKVGFK